MKLLWCSGQDILLPLNSTGFNSRWWELFKKSQIFLITRGFQKFWQKTWHQHLLFYYSMRRGKNWIAAPSSDSMKRETNVDGVMAARGLLENPAFYAGYDLTPKECVSSWLRIALDTGTQFPCFHHHLSYMLERSMPRPERKYFNGLNSTSAVIDYLEDRFGITYL